MDGYVASRVERSNRHRDCFNQTVEQFGIKVAGLCDSAKVGESALSRFRSGEADFLAGTFQDVIDALEPKAQAFYYCLLMTTRPHTSSTPTKKRLKTAGAFKRSNVATTEV